MRSILIVVAVVAWSAVANAADNSANSQPGSGQPKFDNVDWELSKAMGITKRYENIVVSPISLRVVLGLLLDAANGTTADEIAKFLQIDAEHLTDKDKIRKHFHELIMSLNTPPDSALTSDVVTRIFADHQASLNETYLKLIKDNYATELEQVDFTQLSEVIQKINKWAEGATHGHISDLLSEGDTDSNAVMLLVNVIFFNGLWTNPFDENQTKTESFYLNDKQYIHVSMMKAQHQLQYAETYDNEYQLLRMPYQGGSFAMYFILPRSRNGLNELLENITPARVHSLMKTMTEVTVNVTLPRFKFSYNIGLKPVLEKFGIKKMFQTSADFSNMENNSSSLFVSNILQKAGIEVNEKGSTAYASTVADVQNKFGGDTTVDFRANRPFLFFIEEDKTRTVVFVGKVTNPAVFAKSAGPQDRNKTPLQGVTTPQLWGNAEQTKTTSNVDYKQGNSAGQTLLEQKQLSYFDIALLDVLGRSNKNKNIVLSPVSIKTVLGLLLHGAEGETAAELQLALHLSENQTEAEQQLQRLQQVIEQMTIKFSVKTANAVLLANQLKPNKGFENYAVTKYFSAVRNINLQDPSSAVKEINEWIKTKTEGLIPTAVSPGLVQQDTKLILVNAMYFKAKWLHVFPPQATRAHPFHKRNSKAECVRMMSLRAPLKYNYESELDADVLQIPFQNHKYKFAIILPRKIGGIQKLLDTLNHNSIIDFLDDQDSLEVTLSLPRFTAEFEIELTKTLKDLNIREIFSDNATLPNIIEGKKNIKVSAIVHKALIEVNEEGAKAAAATVSSVVPLMSPSGSVDIVVDRPFLFFIYNRESRTVLFEGQISHPEEASEAECEEAKNLKPIKAVLDDIYNIDIRRQQTAPQTQNGLSLSPNDLQITNNNGNQQTETIQNSQNNRNEYSTTLTDRIFSSSLIPQRNQQPTGTTKPQNYNTNQQQSITTNNKKTSNTVRDQDTAEQRPVW